MEKWALGLRTVPLQGVHTNNFIESWHRNLKYHFLDRSSPLRPDEFIHTLVFEVVPDFRQTVMATQLGFRSQRHTKFQGISKGEADSYTDQDLQDLGINIWPESSTQVSNRQSYSLQTLLLTINISVQSRFSHDAFCEVVPHHCYTRRTSEVGNG